MTIVTKANIKNKQVKIVLLIIYFISISLMANEKNVNISKIFWSKGYIYEIEHDYKRAYENYVISANEINVPNKPKDFDSNYILWSIEAILKILQEYPELSTIKDELYYWNLKLLNSKNTKLQDAAILRIYSKAKNYEDNNDYKNAYKYYLALANKIDSINADEEYYDNYIIWSIDNIRKILKNNHSVSTIKNEKEYWTSKLRNSKSKIARNLDISSAWNKAYKLEKKKDFKNAYKYYKISANLGDTMSMVFLSKVLEKKPKLSTIENEIEFWLLKAVENVPSKDESFAITSLEKYYRDTNQTKKRKVFMQDMYEKYHNLQLGCSLASTLYFEKDYIKSFDLAKEIYEKNENLPLFNSCVSTLGYIYSRGQNGIAKNIKKALELQIDYFNQKKEDYLIAVSIAELYLEEKKDYKNAQKWYEIAYNIKKDEQYLNRVEEYKKIQPIYILDKKINQELYPIINNTLLEKNILANTGSNKYIFFATPNKDIKMFEGNTLKFLKSFRGWIGEGVDGLTTAMAFDEKNNLLYATGFNSFEDLSKNEIIKVFDINNGKIINTIDNKNSGTPLNIIISNDGKYLLAINNNGSSFNIIETKSNNLLTFKTISADYRYGIIKQRNNDYFIYILDKDNYINIFSLKKERLIERKQFEGELSFCEKNILLRKGNNIFEVYDYNYKLLHTKKMSNNVIFKNVSLSEDCSKLVFSKNKTVEIFDLDTQQVIRRLDFDNPILQAYLGTSNNLYYMIENKLSLLNLDLNTTYEYQIEKDKKLKYINGLNDTQLDIGYEDNNFIFDSIKLQLFSSDTKSKTNQNNIETTLSYKTIDNRMIEIYNDKNILFKINLYLNSIQKVQIIDDKFIWVDVGYVFIYNLKGELICQIDTLPTTQKNFYMYQNKLYTYGDDNIIHIWNINEIKNINISKNEVFDQEFLKSLNNLYNMNILDFLNTLTTDFIKEQVEINKWSITPTKEEYSQSFKALLVKKEKIKPTASLYIKNAKDWILYTPEGLFTYGGEGYRLLKYHQNQGLYKEAKIIENDQLFDKFYRPDLIKKILAGEKVDIPMDVKSVILNILPPELKILVNKMLNNKDIELTYQICDAGNGIADPKLVINGQAINPPTNRGFTIGKIKSKKEKCKVYKSIHTLYPGKSTIELKAYDKDKNIANISEKIEINADYKIIEKSNISYGKHTNVDDSLENAIVLDKSNLYLLSLAVSDYKDDSYDLRYPVKDVSAIKEQLLTKSKKTFENIYTYELHDDKVSKENIDKIFNDIAHKIKMNDTFVLYIAGHGTTVDGKYQFIPYEITNKISIDNLKENLSKIAANTNKSLVMLDTCYSGTIIDNINDVATKNRLAYDSTINYIVASSSDQVALEGYKNHGIFTYSVLDAFEKNDKLQVWGLADHVSEVVPNITQEKFHFSQIPQAKLNQNFILSGDEK